MNDPTRADDRAEPERSELAHAAAHRHGDAAARRAAARDSDHALPALEAVERVALALQYPAADPHGPTAAPGDLDHARAALDRYELHLLDAARAAGRDWTAIAALLGGPGNAMTHERRVKDRYAELLLAFPGYRPTVTAQQGRTPAAKDTAATHPSGPLARALPLPDDACGIAWGVCPEHGATLAVSGGRTHCQECARSWSGDRLNQTCRESVHSLVAWEKEHLDHPDPDDPVVWPSGVCTGHAIALAASNEAHRGPRRGRRRPPRSPALAPASGREGGKRPLCAPPLPAACGQTTRPYRARRPIRHHRRVLQWIPAGPLRRRPGSPRPVPPDRRRHLPDRDKRARPDLRERPPRITSARGPLVIKRLPLLAAGEAVAGLPDELAARHPGEGLGHLYDRMGLQPWPRTPAPIVTAPPNPRGC